MIDNTFSASASSSIIRPLLFSCAIWSAMLIGCLLYFIFLKQKFHPGSLHKVADRSSLFKWEAWWKLSVQRYNLFHSDKISFAFISHFTHYQPFKNIFQTNCICFYTLNFCISHPSFLHFCIIPTLQIPPRITLYPPISSFIAS